MNDNEAPATIADYAAADFDPLAPATLQRLRSELEPAAWAERTMTLRIKMGLLFGVLGMSKAQMVADLEAKPEALDALMELADTLEELEAWFQAGADFCTAGKTRILIATAVVAEGDPPPAAA